MVGLCPTGAPGSIKTKCLNREEFVVVGWSDPEGSRRRIGALLLGHYTPDGKLIYAGRVETGMPVAELERLYGRSGRPRKRRPQRGSTGRDSAIKNLGLRAPR